MNSPQEINHRQVFLDAVRCLIASHSPTGDNYLVAPLLIGIRGRVNGTPHLWVHKSDKTPWFSSVTMFTFNVLDDVTPCTSEMEQELFHAILCSLNYACYKLHED